MPVIGVHVPENIHQTRKPTNLVGVLPEYIIDRHQANFSPALAYLTTSFKDHPMDGVMEPGRIYFITGFGSVMIAARTEDGSQQMPFGLVVFRQGWGRWC
jgi:hypothetical protein